MRAWFPCLERALETERCVRGFRMHGRGRGEVWMQRVAVDVAVGGYGQVSDTFLGSGMEEMKSKSDSDLPSPSASPSTSTSTLTSVSNLPEPPSLSPFPSPSPSLFTTTRHLTLTLHTTTLTPTVLQHILPHIITHIRVLTIRQKPRGSVHVTTLLELERQLLRNRKLGVGVRRVVVLRQRSTRDDVDARPARGLMWWDGTGPGDGVTEMRREVQDRDWVGDVVCRTGETGVGMYLETRLGGKTGR
ncbi:hypothetical protein K491DRAFT_134351 [Lophiostoma macrostomum CBS 122681]|uniref:Uncharacterized protein n=1 Tax=Lophiostoma macrostomum CBS 122681 TaxID=1314788 RepID=A0A6A6TIM6_9PLEO|nr:hypothetical protein K491DRAFT_134351 [Lophiostoma macrostomum CBS 122681]